jgi:site-specific recombinase XerD
MRAANDDRHGWRLRALIVVLWRGGLRVQEALALGAHDLDASTAHCSWRNGKGGRRRETGMDAWGWEQLRPWLAARVELLSARCSASSTARPAGAVVKRERARRVSPARRPRRDTAPLRITPASPRPRPGARPRGVALNVIQRQLGHANLGTTSIYLQGIDTEEIIATVHARRAPMMSATAGLRL